MDDVGVDAGSSAIASAQAVIISRFRSQPGYVPARHVAHIEALISAHETAKGTAFGYIQPIARRSGYTAPVSCEPARGNVRGGAGHRRGGHGRHTDDVGVDAGSSASVGAHPIIIGPASAQPAHTPADYVAHTEILIPGHESAKGTAGGHIQQVARGSGYTAPVGSEPAVGDVGGDAGRRRRRHGRHTDDVGVAASSCATEGTHPIIIGLASAQPAHTPADHDAQVEILIAGQETAKGTAGGHIQQVARGSAHTAPVSRKAGGGDVRGSFGCRPCRRNYEIVADHVEINAFG